MSSVQHIPCTASEYEFVLFYDGECPICQKEVAWLQWKNKQGRLGFQDINAVGFEPELYATSHADMMAEIHGMYADGRLIKGVEVFYAAYHAVGLGWLMAPTRWPILKPVFECLYAVFARHRLMVGGLLIRKSCEKGKCRV